MGTTAEKLQAVLDSKAAIKAAIENKGVENVGDVLSTYADKIASIKTGGSWTGHADVEGLKAIGWTDDDIAYYQEHGVNWNEADDQYHLVPVDNKALYGVINIDNIQQYKDILVYLPKIDTTGVTNMTSMFRDCFSLISVPLLDTSSVTSMNSMFQNCFSLISVPLLDTSSVTSMNYMFQNCFSMISVPLFDTSSVTSMIYMFYSCYSMISVPLLDTSSVTSMNKMVVSCNSLVYCNLKNLKFSIDISATSLLEKSSLLYMIDNASPTDAITITLSAYCYTKFRNAPDVVAALSKQPLVSLASAA